MKEMVYVTVVREGPNGELMQAEQVAVSDDIAALQKPEEALERLWRKCRGELDARARGEVQSAKGKFENAKSPEAPSRRLVTFVECPQCRGTGHCIKPFVGLKPCHACGGTGRI